jgi:general stress protein 26
MILLATSEEDQPRVRPVTLVVNRGELFVLTGSKDQKVAQIRANGKVECLKLVKRGDSTGYVRFTATATIVKEKAVRIRLAKATSFFDHFWDHHDHPSYTLIRLTPVRVEYLKPGDMEPTPITKLKLE